MNFQTVPLSKTVTRIRRVRYGRQFRVYAERLGLGDAAIRRATKRMKGLIDWRQIARRRRVAKELLLSVEPIFQVSEKTGFIPLDTSWFSEMPEVVAACRDIYEREAPKYDLDDPKNQFRNSLFTRENLEAHPVILRFALDRRVIAPVAAYLGTIPNLVSLQLWWPPKNDSTKGSQLYHLDRTDYRLLKYFVNINDVDETSGPFTFLPADVSTKVAATLVPEYDRKTDEEIFARARPQDSIALSGRPGSGAVVDSCRCYHYGGRARGGERIVLMLQFQKYNCILESADTWWYRTAKVIQLPDGIDHELARMVLDLPPSIYGDRTES